MVRHLAPTARPSIAVAGSVMLGSGRIVNYLKTMLRYFRHDVRFIGCQVQGRFIQMYGKCGFYVEFDHERYNIGAKINIIGGDPVHADQ